MRVSLQVKENSISKIEQELGVVIRKAQFAAKFGFIVRLKEQII
jgi:hypothetical protein